MRPSSTSIEAYLESLADSKRKVIFLLERADFDVAKVGKVKFRYWTCLETFLTVLSTEASLYWRAWKILEK